MTLRDETTVTPWADVVRGVYEDFQWGRITKILSLGAVPRMVPTDHGPVLFLSNEEGSAAFWHP
jgi:hypothetical protein